MGKQALKSLATVFQYLFPIALLCGSGASAIGRFKRKKLLTQVVRGDSASVIGEMKWQNFELLVVLWRPGAPLAGSS
jgi:hypothetical protein